MAVPDFQSLMLPVLRATASGETTAAELRQRVAVDLGLSDDDLEQMLPSRRQTTFANRTAWANVFLQRSRLIERVARGLYRITDTGRQVLAERPARIDIRYLQKFPEFSEWRRSSRSGEIEENGQPDTAAGSTETATPEEQLERGHAALVEALEQEVLDRVRSLSPAFFERLVIDLLTAMGYGGGRAEMGRAVGRPGDSGIDGIIKEDALGLDIVYVQAKKYAPDNPVHRPEVQQFSGSLDGVGATKGIFLTTSTFSAGAWEFAKGIAKRIILVDGAELARLLVLHNVGVRIRATFELKKIDEDYFSE